MLNGFWPSPAVPPSIPLLSGLLEGRSPPNPGLAPAIAHWTQSLELYGKWLLASCLSLCSLLQLSDPVWIFFWNGLPYFSVCKTILLNLLDQNLGVLFYTWKNMVFGSPPTYMKEVNFWYRLEIINVNWTSEHLYSILIQGGSHELQLVSKHFFILNDLAPICSLSSCLLIFIFVIKELALDISISISMYLTDFLFLICSGQKWQIPQGIRSMSKTITDAHEWEGPGGGWASREQGMYFSVWTLGDLVWRIKTFYLSLVTYFGLGFLISEIS